MAETDEQALRELDRQGADAVLARDAAALEGVYDEQFVLHYGEVQRIRSRAEVLAGVATQLHYRSFTRQPDYVAVHGDIGVTMGSEQVVSERPHGTGPAADQPFNRRYTHVYRRRNGAWTLLVRHVNHVGDG